MLRDLHFPGISRKKNETQTDPGVRIADANAEKLFPDGLVYSSPARGTWTIAHTSMLIPGSHQIFVCPSCCLRGVVLSAEEMGAMERFSMLEFTDEHILKGDLESMIIEGVTEILREMERKPSCVLLYTSCVQHFLNIDLSLVYRETAARFPYIDFIDCYMLPTMRKHFTPEKMQWRQLYRAVAPLERNALAVNFIGSFYEIDKECELYEILPQDVRQLPTMNTYDEYKRMGEAACNIYFNPVVKFAADDMEKRLGQKGIYLPVLYDFREIERYERELYDMMCSLAHSVTANDAPAASQIPGSGVAVGEAQAIASGTAAKTPAEPGNPGSGEEISEVSTQAAASRAWFDTLRYEAEAALGRARSAVGIREIAIDGAAVTRPLSLAKMLFKQGFRVTRVYADAFVPEEMEDFRWLQIHVPEIRIYPMTDYRMRMASREPAGPGFVAIGQKATYFTGTRHFVNLVENGGLYGFRGIRRLAEMIEDAARHAKDPGKLIQIKALGCTENCGRLAGTEEYA